MAILNSKYWFNYDFIAKVLCGIGGLGDRGGWFTVVWLLNRSSGRSGCHPLSRSFTGTSSVACGAAPPSYNL